MRRLLLVLLTAALTLGLAGPAMATPAGWTGYTKVEIFNPNAPDVATGTITIPWFNCDGLAGDRAVVAWVALDARELSQAGVTMFCNRETGQKWVSAWYENWPLEPEPTPITEFIEPRIGDKVSVRVEQFVHRVEFTVRNETRDKVWNQSFPIERADVWSRDWMTERVGGLAGVPNFGRIVFEKSNGFPSGMEREKDFGQLSDLYDGDTKFHVSNS